MKMHEHFWKEIKAPILYIMNQPAEGAKDVLIGLIKIFQVESENTQQYVNVYSHKIC